jgi:hypothetical protein
VIRFDEGWFFVVLMLDVFCVIDIIGSREDDVRNLPKIAWLLLVLFFPFIGSVAWLAAGRPNGQLGGRSPYERRTTAFPEYDRPGRAAGMTPESDEEFLRKIRERAEEQRQKGAAQKKAAEEAAQRAAGESDPGSNPG